MEIQVWKVARRRFKLTRIFDLETTWGFHNLHKAYLRREAEISSLEVSSLS